MHGSPSSVEGDSDSRWVFPAGAWLLPALSFIDSLSDLWSQLLHSVASAKALPPQGSEALTDTREISRPDGRADLMKSEGRTLRTLRCAPREQESGSSGCSSRGCTAYVPNQTQAFGFFRRQTAWVQELGGKDKDDASAPGESINIKKKKKNDISHQFPQ